MKITIHQPVLRGEVALPVSKSLMQRHWIIRALHSIPASYEATDGIADLETLSALLRHSEADTWHCGESGACARFALALAVRQQHPVRLMGSPRLCERPMGPLVDALRELGASIAYEEREGFLPLRITPAALRGGRIKVDTGLSSQFVSALMMLGSLLPGGLEIETGDVAVSWPYIALTAAVMQTYHLNVELPEDHSEGSVVIRVGHGKAVSEEPLNPEGDWSAAAFWYQAVALAAEAEVLLTNLEPFSVQGDAVLPDIYDVLGVATDFTENGVRLRKAGPPETALLELDLSDTPDLFPALAATAAGLGIEAEFSGIGRLSLKESHRPAALRQELAKVGAEMILEGDVARLLPARLDVKCPVAFHSHGDHRVAMALAPLALKLGEVMVEPSDVVAKSYPQFWQHLKQCLIQGSLKEGF